MSIRRGESFRACNEAGLAMQAVATRNPCRRHPLDQVWRRTPKVLTENALKYLGEGSDALKGAPGEPFRVTGKINNERTYNLVAYPGSEGMPAGNYKVGISTVQGRNESNILNRTLRIARRSQRTYPRLIPVFGHRYIPDEPSEAGNQVFSMMGVDIMI
jgi:hypothetical protein